jgi:hypothetical protein
MILLLRLKLRQKRVDVPLLLSLLSLLLPNDDEEDVDDVLLFV